MAESNDVFLNSIRTITNVTDGYSLAEYQKSLNIQLKEREIITMRREIEDITKNCEFLELQIQKSEEVVKFLDETIESEIENEQLFQRARILLEQKYRDDKVKIEKEKEASTIKLNQDRESLNRFKESFEKLPHVIKLRETEIERKKAEIQCTIMQQRVLDQKRKNKQLAEIKQRIFHVKIINIVKNIMEIQRLDKEREQVLLEEQEIIKQYEEKLKAQTEENTLQNSKILKNPVSISVEGLAESNFRLQEKIKALEVFSGKMKNLENISSHKRSLEVPANIAESHIKRYKNMLPEINEQQNFAANKIQNELPRDIENKEELGNLQEKQICGVPKKTEKAIPAILSVEIVQNMQHCVNLNSKNQSLVQMNDRIYSQEQPIGERQNGAPNDIQEPTDINITYRDFEPMLDNMPYREQKSGAQKSITPKSTQETNYAIFEQKIQTTSTPYISENLCLETKLDQAPILTAQKNYNTLSDDQPNNLQTVSKFFKQNEPENTNSKPIIQAIAENEPSTQTMLHAERIRSRLTSDESDVFDENSFYPDCVSPPVVMDTWNNKTNFNEQEFQFGAFQSAKQENNMFMFSGSPKKDVQSFSGLF